MRMPRLPADSRRSRCPRRARSPCSWCCPPGSGWKREMEGGSAVYGPFGPDSTSVPMHDALHGRETDSGPGELVRGVESLKRCEELVGEGHVEPGAVVAHEVGP